MGNTHSFVLEDMTCAVYVCRDERSGLLGGDLKKEEIISTLYALISPIVEASGMELIEIRYHRGVRGRSILRIFIDKKDGVTIEDCERLSRQVEAEMDVEDIIPESYILEVSSPGLDRPLRKIEDYRRNIGRLIEISTYAPINKQRFFVGRVNKVEGDKITLMLEDGKNFIIPLSQISKANLRIEF